MKPIICLCFFFPLVAGPVYAWRTVPWVFQRHPRCFSLVSLLVSGACGNRLGYEQWHVALKHSATWLLAVVASLVRSCVPAALKRVELEECVRWMVPFAMALREIGGSSMKTFTGIPADDMHNIQTHASYMTWLVSWGLLIYYILTSFQHVVSPTWQRDPLQSLLNIWLADIDLTACVFRKVLNKWAFWPLHV